MRTLEAMGAVLRLVPLWVVAAACAALLIGLYLLLHARLNARAATLNSTLAGIGLERPKLAEAPAPPKPHPIDKMANRLVADPGTKRWRDGSTLSFRW